jgi:hypothetical protein
MRCVLYADGRRVDLVSPVTVEAATRLIGAKFVDVVRLHHLGLPLHVMLVDDVGHDRHLPVNRAATELYHANCIPGTTHEIVGDVIVCPDGDFS